MEGDTEAGTRDWQGVMGARSLREARKEGSRAARNGKNRNTAVFRNRKARKGGNRYHGIVREPGVHDGTGSGKFRPLCTPFLL